MNRLFQISALFIAFLLLSSITIEKRGTMEVTLTNLRNVDGQIMISLNRGREGFPKSNYYIQKFIPDFDAPSHTIIFKDIPYGDYAIGVLHDEDKNNKMTSNFIGIPKEGFGFYRNFKVSLRAPYYNEVSFELQSPNLKMDIELQY